MEKYPDVIQRALEFEEKGAAFYNESAQNAKNVLVRKLFEYLAMEEKRHQERIEQIYQALRSGKTWPQTEVASSLEGAVRKFFNGLSEQERRVNDNLDALQVAMDMERKGYDMYNHAAKETGESMEERFFEAMKREEQDHLEALENVYHYLNNTEDWFAEEESKTWNWMTF